jgi:N-methylhydantoinase A
MVSLSLGADPRDFTLFAFGGAGPLHAAALARELGLPRVLVPARPGLVNALGCVVADLRHDFVRTLNRPLAALDITEVHAILSQQEAQGRALIGAESVAATAITASFAADMQFVGQTHLLRVPLADARPSLADLQSRFEAAYLARFRVRLPEVRAALVNLATSVTGHRPPVDLRRLLDPAARASTLAGARTARRPVRFDDGWRDTPVYRRARLPTEATLAGPAILEQMDTTIVLPPGDRLSQDADGNLLIEIGGG